MRETQSPIVIQKALRNQLDIIFITWREDQQYAVQKW